MSEATLTLSPHELYFLPPGTPATAPATRVEVEGEGEMRVFLARWIRDADDWCVLFYRGENSEEILTHSGRISGDVLAANAANRDDEISFIINFVMPPPILRYWCSGDKEYGIIVEKKGRVRVIVRRKINSKPITFGIKIPWDAEEFADYPQREFIDFFQSMSDNANSVLNLALRWEDLEAIRIGS